MSSPKPLAELVDTAEPVIVSVREWAQHADHASEILPPSDKRGAVLLSLQITTRATLGALAYETGGVIVADGWLRFLGSGHARLTRDLATWNESRAHGFYLVADDAAGGFFALNGGAFGPDRDHVYYWPPDSIEGWEPLSCGFTDFFRWSLTPKLDVFYERLRWPSWKEDAARLSGDRCFSFSPALWTNGASVERSLRHEVPVAQIFDQKLEIARQRLGDPA